MAQKCRRHFPTKHSTKQKNPLILTHCQEFSNTRSIQETFWEVTRAIGNENHQTQLCTLNFFELSNVSYKKLVEYETNVIMVSFFTRFWILVVKTFWDFSRSCGGSASEFSPKSRSLDAVGLERHFVGKNSPLQKPKGVFLMTLSISI